jgi:hypothetical protein
MAVAEVPGRLLETVSMMEFYASEFLIPDPGFDFLHHRSYNYDHHDSSWGSLGTAGSP